MHSEFKHSFMASVLITRVGKSEGFMDNTTADNTDKPIVIEA